MIFYLVPGSADFNHNFLATTKTNEKPCTITPCYSPDEETLTAQHRPRIVEGSVDGSPAEIEAEKRELAALRHRRTPIGMDGARGKVALAPLPPRPTPEHPATESIIPSGLARGSLAPEYPEVRNGRTWVVVQMRPEGANRTHVIVSHLGWKQGPEWDRSYDHFVQGWDDLIERLEKRATDGPIEWNKERMMYQESRERNR